MTNIRIPNGSVLIATDLEPLSQYPWILASQSTETMVKLIFWYRSGRLFLSVTLELTSGMALVTCYGQSEEAVDRLDITETVIDIKTYAKKTGRLADRQASDCPEMEYTTIRRNLPATTSWFPHQSDSS